MDFRNWIQGAARREYLVLAAATVFASAAAAPVAFAQQEEGETDEATILEEIVVTGSRLARTNFDAPTPLVQVGEQDIAASTSPSIGDLLNDLPQLRSTFGLNNSGRFIGTAGIGLLDLRGLGDERTLVLVNGRRHVGADPGSTVVDVNSIPPEMIERIEVITGANSAVYGADAVSGVVNFILKDDFEGVAVNASVGDADDTSFGRESLSLTIGKNFAEGAGNAVFAITYDSQDLLTAGQRGGEFTEQWGEVPNPADGDTIVDGIQVDDGIPDDIFVRNQGFWALSNAGYSFFLGGRLAPDGSFIQDDPSSWQFVDGLSCGGANCPALDLDSFAPLQVGLDRFTLNANFTYDLSPDAELFFESKYAQVESNQQGQPSFDFFSFTGAAAGGGDAVILRDNAFISPSLGAAMDAAGLPFIDLQRFNVDLGLRKENNTRETLRTVLGVRGEIFDTGYDYEVFANYGRTFLERVNFNNRINDRWLAAVDAVEIDEAGAAALVTSGLNPGAAAGDIVCRSTLQEAQGEDSGLPAFAFQDCVPANILGLGLISDEAKDFINATAVATSELEQTQIAAVVTNPEIVDLWAGPLGGVVGYEYREEQSRTEGDALSQTVDTFFNNLSDTIGEFDVNEFFGEVSVPLLRDVPFVQDLTFEGAIRLSDYSTIGSTTTWETRLNWQPLDDLRFRFNTGEALRAPTIDDLFAPEGQNFANVDDPCDFQNLDDGTAGRNTRIANCQALGIADPENFDSRDESSVNLLQGGNDELKEETADTFTAGFVYTPNWLEGFSFAADYYDIEIEDAIAFTGTQAILDRCVDNPAGINNQFCNLVTRDADGNITQVRQFPLNLNALRSSGWDFEVDYVFDIGRWGTLQNRLIGSYLQERVFELRSADNVDQVEGELGDPEWQLNYRGTWLFGNWTSFLEIRWIDEMFRFEQETLFGSAVNQDPNPDISSVTTAHDVFYFDVGTTYRFEDQLEGLEVGLVIDNVTDENPPFPFFGNGAGSGIYDSIGRFYSLRATYRFGQ